MDIDKRLHEEVYRFPLRFAREHGELEAFKQSQRLNRDCVTAIDAGIRNRFGGKYPPKDMAADLLVHFGEERVSAVLANTVRFKDYDGRFSPRNKAWANDVPPLESDPKTFTEAHPALLDTLINCVRAEIMRVHLNTLGKHEDENRIAEVNRLTWRNKENGIYAVKPGVSEERIAEQYHGIARQKTDALSERNGSALSERVQGYEIKHALCFSNDRGFALGFNPQAVSPYVTWQFSEEGGRRDYYWGKYYASAESAAKNYDERIGEYRADYPSLTEKGNTPNSRQEKSVSKTHNPPTANPYYTRRFDNVDIIATLETIMRGNTVNYRSDFEYDRETLNKAATSTDPNDATLLWYSRKSGTYCQSERDAYIGGTSANNAWTYYAGYGESLRAFAVEIMGTRDGRPVGSLCELDYEKHAEHVKRNAIPLESVTLTFADGSFKPFTLKEYNMHWFAIQEIHGRVTDLKYEVKDENVLQSTLNKEHDARRELPGSSIKPYLEQLNDVTTKNEYGGHNNLERGEDASRYEPEI